MKAPPFWGIRGGWQLGYVTTNVAGFKETSGNHLAGQDSLEFKL